MADSSVLTIAAWNARLRKSTRSHRRRQVVVARVARAARVARVVVRQSALRCCCSRPAPLVGGRHQLTMQGVLTQMCPDKRIHHTCRSPATLMQADSRRDQYGHRPGWCNQCYRLSPNARALHLCGLSRYVSTTFLKAMAVRAVPAVAPQPRNFSFINGHICPLREMHSMDRSTSTHFTSTGRPTIQARRLPAGRLSGKVSGCSYQADISAYGYWQDMTCCATPHNPYNGSDGVFDFNDCGLNCEEWYCSTIRCSRRTTGCHRQQPAQLRVVLEIQIGRRNDRTNESKQ